MLQIIAVEPTSLISLHAGRSISDISVSQITAYNCQTGYMNLKTTLFEKDFLLAKSHLKLCLIKF